MTAVLAVIAVPLCILGVRAFRALNRRQRAEIESKRAAVRNLPEGWLDRRMPMATRVLMAAIGIAVVLAVRITDSTDLLWICGAPYVAVFIYLLNREEKTMISELTEELRKVVASDGITVALEYVDTIESVHGKSTAARIRSNLGIV